MNGPEVELSCVGNVFTRLMHFKRSGDIEQGHSHPFDHVTLVSSGSVRVTLEGCSRDFVAPCLIYIQKNKQHQLVALSDNTVVACIHALRDESGEIIPENSMLSPEEYSDLVDLTRVKE